MKKTFLSLAMIAALSSASFAQVFVGGSFGYNRTKASSETTFMGRKVETKLPSSTSFSLKPKVGVFLGEKLSVGGHVQLGSVTSTSYSTTGQSSTMTGVEVKKREKVSTWGLGGFARYSFLQAGKFSVIAEGSVGCFGSSQKVIVNSTKTNGPRTFGIGMNLVPVLEYRFSDAWAIESTLNFLNLAVTTQTTTTKDPQNTSNVTKNHENSFDIGVINGQTINSISLGLTYTFN